MPGILRFDPERLVGLRLDRGFSREELAVLLGRSYQSVRFYEKGSVTPPADIIGRLATLLHAEPSDFFSAETMGIRS